MCMKRLIKKLFKIEPQLEYIIAEYQPIEITRLKIGFNIKENNINKAIYSNKKTMNKIQ